MLWYKLTLHFFKKALFPMLFVCAVAIKVMLTGPSAAYSCSLMDARNQGYGSNSQQEASPLNDPDVIVKKARNMVKAGNYQKALSLLSPFPSEPMKYPALYSDYLVILSWKGNADEAIALFENLPDSFPLRPYLLRNMAKAYYDKEVFWKALLLYKKVLNRTPLDQEAQKGLVLSIMKAGDLERAYTAVQRFLKQNPNSLSLLRIKADILIKRDKYLEALELYRILSKRETVDAEQIYTLRDDFIESLPLCDQKALLQNLRAAAQGGSKEVQADYILALVLTGDYISAIKVFEAASLDCSDYPDHLLSWIAWSYFKIGTTQKAKLCYQEILSRNPDYGPARIGISYCYSIEGDTERAIRDLEKLSAIAPNSPEIMFARAFAHEQAKRFWKAIQEYDRILELSPAHSIARRLRLLAMSDMGASSYALQLAQEEFPSDHAFHDAFKGDIAVDRIRWGEFKEAIAILSPLSAFTKTHRYKYDYIIALVKDNQIAKAVDCYEKLVAEGIALPSWLLEEVAWAYLYIDQPYKALELCDEALKAQPLSFNGRMVKFYALQEIREWKNAEQMLNELDQEIPAIIGQNRNIRPNWTKLDIALARGWLFISKDMLREAERYFEELREQAPANTGIRNSLAHVYFFRGWPRKALKEFRIIETVQPGFFKAQTGKIMALNELALKKQAREKADNLLSARPREKEIQGLLRRLKLEEMREFSTDAMASREDDDTEEIRFGMNLSQPLSLYTKLDAFLLWQQVQYQDQSNYFRRAGLGIDHVLSSSFDLRQQFTINYDDGDDFGSFSRINFHPDDYWRLSASYDSFTTDVPVRARLYDITAKKFDMGITYRESEWRNYNLSFTHFTFSDGNDRDQVLIGYEQGLWTKDDWKMRLFLNFFTSQNTRGDAPYFNPESDWSVSATHMTEHTAYRISTRSFVHRMFLSLGNYKQSGYSSHVVGSIRYEQEHEFSDTQALLWGARADRNVYDGEAVHGISFYANFRWLF